MTIDWASYLAGAVSATFLLTLARVVQRMQATATPAAQAAAPTGPTAPLAPATAGAVNMERAITAPLIVVGQRDLAGPNGAPVATGPFSNSRPFRPTTAPLAFVADLPPEVVAGKLVREHPYLAAYVLDHLDNRFVERVLTLMGEGPRRDVQDLLGRGESLKLSGEAFVALLNRLKASALGGAS